MKALHVHHDAKSSSGVMGEVLDELGIDSVEHQVCLTAGSPVGSSVFPDPAQFDLLLVYGSRWSVYDEAVQHWVAPELEFLRRADATGVAVVGMCFGGQLLSAAHGGGVAPGVISEVGWLSVQPDSPTTDNLDTQSMPIDPGPWMQWHFDCFEVPPGAQGLAHSSAGPQAFLLRKNLAVQFHPEVTRSVLEEWFVDDLDQLAAAGVDPESLLIEADRQAVAGRNRARGLLENFLAARSAKNMNVF